MIDSCLRRNDKSTARFFTSFRMTPPHAIWERRYCPHASLWDKLHFSQSRSEARSLPDMGTRAFVEEAITEAGLKHSAG